MNAIALITLLGFCITTQEAIAQVIPDNTVGTLVSPVNLINGGTRTGNNLFHSFSQFSIPTGSSAIFNNPTDIQNIFSRVTGNTRSSIDGLIKANGTANLFLMNPNGIIFGPNARLNIGGSFLGTTANTIQFADGVKFSSSDISSNPLLTVSLPIGLQMGTTSGSITVLGNGHQLSNQTISAGITGTSVSPQLQVRPGKTLALIGERLTIVGGILQASDGQVELGAIGVQNNSIVNFQIAPKAWTFDYGGITNFSPITISKRGLVDASGLNPGQLQLTGSNISLQDGSFVMIQNQGNGTSGDIRVNASDRLAVQGLSSLPKLAFSTLLTYAYSNGSAGNIIVDSPQILVNDRAEIRATTRGNGTAGDITLQANKLIQLDNAITTADGKVQGLSTIANTTNGNGNAGFLTLNTPYLKSLPGTSISGITNGRGQGASIVVNATDAIDLIGTTSSLSGSSTITVSTGGLGSAGNLTINTAKLLLQGGGSVRANNFLNGKGGSILINATDSINVVGEAIDRVTGKQLFPSQISTSTSTQFVPNPSGDSGRITVNTPQLQIADKGEISISNFGTGNSENLQIRSQFLTLRNQGKILAVTRSGQGGNIGLRLDNALVLRNGSLISTSAGGIGNGGNISIVAPILVGLGNSDIIANAVKGRGGNIAITTQGIIGLKYRPYLTRENDITASSEFGVNGTVQVNSLGLDPSSSLVKLDGDVIDSSRSIAKGCAANQGNSFISTGRGGIPQNPMRKIEHDRTWTDMRSLPTSNTTAMIQGANIPIVEAASIQKNPDGSIALIDSHEVMTNLSMATCGIATY